MAFHVEEKFLVEDLRRVKSNAPQIVCDKQHSVNGFQFNQRYSATRLVVDDADFRKWLANFRLLSGTNIATTQNAGQPEEGAESNGTANGSHVMVSVDSENRFNAPHYS
jgi:hypothetical protein